MRAAEFNAILDLVVTKTLEPLGFRPHGRSLRYDDGLAQAALLRTELRSTPPARLAFGYRHAFLRSYDTEAVLDEPPTNLAEYPVKIAPSALPAVTTGAWRYTPMNLGRWPSDSIDYPNLTALQVHQQLVAVADTIATTFPQVRERWSPDRLRQDVIDDGENAWCERLWVEDYDDFLRALPPADRPVY